jgi:hypothetical protein
VNVGSSGLICGNECGEPIVISERTVPVGAIAVKMREIVSPKLWPIG